LVSVRVLMRLVPSIYGYSVFFNVPLFLIFVIFLVRIANAAGRSLEPDRRKILVACLLGAEAVLLVTTLIPDPKLLPAPLTTELGTLYTRKDVSILFPQIISFMKSHTRNGKDILVLPEPPSLYVFAGMQAPTQWYSLVPGYVAPDEEQKYIDEVAANQVRYVLISNRIVTEYHVRGFANGGYNQLIYQWIMQNYAKVGQFGPLPDAPYPPYTMWVYEKKDLAQEKN